MSVKSNHNPKFIEISYEEIYEDFKPKDFSYWNAKTVVKELNNLNIDTANKTITEVLKETYLKEQDIFDIYGLAHTNFSLDRFHKTLYYYNLQGIKSHLKEVALWLYDGKVMNIPPDLKTQMHITNLDLKFTI
jgi:hypothetical protein